METSDQIVGEARTLRLPKKESPYFERSILITLLHYYSPEHNLSWDNLGIRLVKREGLLECHENYSAMVNFSFGSRWL